MRWNCPELKKGGAVKSKRVLILDNDLAQAPRLKDCFDRFHHGCEYDVVAATSVSETVTALTKGRPDLIILEPEMDEFDALSMVGKLRQHDRAIPIIALSKGTKREAVEAIFRLGLFAYVPKPVDFAPFEHIVAMACGSA
jgi:CheY-like chemotaxis protein